MARHMKVAVVQAKSIFNDLSSTFEKVIKIMDKCALNQVDLVVFSQSFLPYNPNNLSFVENASINDLKSKFYKLNLTIDDQSIQILKEKCARSQIALSIGISEYCLGDDQIYNTNIIIDKKGELVSKHRLNTLVGIEKLLWQSDNEIDFKPVVLDDVKVGSLTNFENYNPYARSHLLIDNIELYIVPNSITHDYWHDSLRHLALESKAFVLSANLYDGDYYQGGSCIIGPNGDYLVDATYNKEAILIADLDLDACRYEKMDYSPAKLISDLRKAK